MPITFLWYWGLNSGLCACKDRNSTTWAIPPSLHALVILEIGSPFLPRQTWTLIILFYAFHCMICICHHAWLFSLRWSFTSFFSQAGIELWSSWSQPPDLSLLISASWITCDNRHVLLHPAIGWDGVLQTFCLFWTPSLILHISASKLTKIAGMSHL
jgi:hypothetical protein